MTTTAPPSLLKEFRAVYHIYGNQPDQQKADGLLRITRGFVVGSFLGFVLVMLLDAPSRELFTLVGLRFTPSRVGVLLVFINSVATLLVVARLLNRGRLETASRVTVIGLFLGATALVATNNPSSAMMMMFSIPIVAAGVLLDSRLITRAGFAAVGIVAALALLNGAQMLPVIVPLLPEELIFYTALIIFVDIVMLRVFAAGRLILFQERLQLTDQLEASLREIQILNTSLEQRVVERTREAELARQEAERANSVKSQFLAAMSHELRTPLNGIMNFTGFVADGMLGPVNEKQSEILKEAITNADHLLSLINDVLDISKIEAGSLRLFVEDNVNVVDEINTAVANGRVLLAGKPVALVVELDPALPTLRCDKRRIRQIMLNILSNACKFTDEGTITVRASQQGGEILFSVSDTGPGIDPADHDAVFEAFRQTDSGLRHGGGTGLGMPISRRLAEAHGGRLWIESARGQGTTVFFALPVENQPITL